MKLVLSKGYISVNMEAIAFFTPPHSTNEMDLKILYSPYIYSLFYI